MEKSVGLDLLRFILKKKKSYLLVGILSIPLFGVASFFLNNIYTSTSVLAPVKTTNGPNPPIGSSSFTSLIGLDMIDNSDRSEEALVQLRSYAFFLDWVEEFGELKNLIALKGWDSKTNKLIYNTSIYDPVKNDWKIDLSSRKETEYSLQDAHEDFLQSFKLSKNRDNGFVYLSIDHQSPEIAKRWLDQVISLINEIIKEKEKEKAISSLNFLNGQMSETNLTEIREVLSDLVKQNTQTLMLAEISEEFVFSVIDPPFVPEEHSKPVRILIIILGLIFSLVGLTIFHSYIFFISKLKKSE